MTEKEKFGAGYLAGLAGTHVSDATFERWTPKEQEAYLRGQELAKNYLDDGDMLGGEDD